MKFWIVKCIDQVTNEKIEFTLASDKNAEKEKIKKDLTNVYPDYRQITLRKGKKPKDWILFEGII